MEYCHYDYEDEEHDCSDYMECEECPYYYADLDQEEDNMKKFFNELEILITCGCIAYILLRIVESLQKGELE